MNYRAIYIKLVLRPELKKRIKHCDTYYESHHIFPKSIFPEYKQNKHNLVLLTAREHFIAHKLLCKIFPCKEMYAAKWQMCIKKFKTDNKKFDYTISNREYEKAKLDFIKSNQTEELKYKRSQTNIKTWSNPLLREQHSNLIKNIYKTKPIEDEEKRLKNLKSRICSKIKCITTNEIFDSIIEAIKAYNLKSSIQAHITECCQGKRKHAGKLNNISLSWCYINESYRNKNYKSRGFVRYKKE